VKTRVAIIYGGRSGEHEISLRSAESIMKALDAERYEIVKYFIDRDGRWSPRAISPEPGRNEGIDVVFPVLHGTFGEDGTVQGLLELADLPYVGPGVLASSAAMDKEVAKRLMREAGVPVVEYYLAAGPQDAERNLFGYPVFVKPANLGSSVGISKAGNVEELRAAISFARQYDRKVLVERAIVGQEIECAVLGNGNPEASIPCEILPSRDFYDYEDKYILDKTEFRVPAAVPAEQIAQVRKTAVDAYKALACEGMARVDFLIEKASGTVYINEVNTIPGFTSISMYPKMWEHSGLPYPKLLDRLIELALERHAEKRALKYTR
jgi:D-alanine-D-alanine ligase